MELDWIKLPLFEQFLKEQDDVDPEAELNQQLGDLDTTRGELINKKQEATASGNAIKTATTDIDLQIVDLKTQIEKLKADKSRIEKEGV